MRVPHTCVLGSLLAWLSDHLCVGIREKNNWSEAIPQVMHNHSIRGHQGLYPSEWLSPHIVMGSG